MSPHTPHAEGMAPVAGSRAWTTFHAAAQALRGSTSTGYTEPLARLFEAMAAPGFPLWRHRPGWEDALELAHAVLRQGTTPAGQPCPRQDPHAGHEWHTPVFRRDCPGVAAPAGPR